SECRGGSLVASAEGVGTGRDGIWTAPARAAKGRVGSKRWKHAQGERKRAREGFRCKRDVV
ncbi:MAG: hypothetical protein WCA20_34835, partial [Candidatus Sulfotelmatobacter sp.]